MKLIILNNLSQALHAYETIKFDKVIFAPVLYTEVQREFWEKRFIELKKQIPGISWETLNEIEVDDNDMVAAFDAYDENKKFSNSQLLVSNNLFTELEFSVPEGFTSFRKKAERSLPDYYTNYNKPYDKEVIDELNYYFKDTELPSTYFDDRNGLVGRDYSTKLSKYLSSGCLDVRYLYNQIKDYEESHGANKSTYWLVFELLWREFFYWHYQKHKKMYFSKNGLYQKEDFSEFELIDVNELEDKLELENPLILACHRELTETGYMSNRARQIYASYLLNIHKIDWRSGAELFERFLIDYDVFSNFGNWQYLAGVGVDPRAKNGQIRFFNPLTQLQKYNPDCSYIRKWVPELSKKSIKEIYALCTTEV